MCGWKRELREGSMWLALSVTQGAAGSWRAARAWYPSSPGTSIWEGITSRISSSDTRELWDDAPRIDLRPESWTTCQCDERMPIEKTYSEAGQHLAALLDRVVEDRETIIIRRRNG